MEQALRDILLSTEPLFAEPGKSDAAVAILLTENHQELLLIQRAANPRDPWSGQMALPGGRRETSDTTLRATAIRETKEEIGVTLTEEEYLGHLPRLEAHSKRGKAHLWVTPHVFLLKKRPSHFTLNHEVAKLLWIRLSELDDDANRSEFEFEKSGQRLRFPAWKLEGHTVWGLTYRILSGLQARLRDTTPSAEGG